MKNVGNAWRVAVLSMTLALVGAGGVFAGDGCADVMPGPSVGGPAGGRLTGPGLGATSPEACMDAYLKHSKSCRLQHCFYFLFVAITCDGELLDDCMDNAQTTFDLCVKA